jgi:rare lipoprotein A
MGELRAARLGPAGLEVSLTVTYRAAAAGFFRRRRHRSAFGGVAPLMVARVTILLLALGLAACATTPPSAPEPAPAPMAEQPSFSQTGIASWYGRGHHGKMTAQGEPFDMNKMTAAHRTLPLDTTVRVTNLANRKTVKVRINDRGPYVAGRVIDLSARAAKELAITDGIARVRIEVFTSDQQVAEN